MKLIQIKSPDSSIIYSDIEEHFENGLLRLMSMNRELFNKWIALAEQSSRENLLDKLTDGFDKLYLPVKTNFSKVENGPQNEIGRLWHPNIDKDFGLAVANDNSIGWLVRYDGDIFVRETNPPVYEENYFEGDPTSAGGYGDYAAQAEWRLEKSKRQVSELSDITGLQLGYVLDVGSGYGYFRKALDEAGFKHEGVEISKHANAISKKLYGFDSYLGTLSDHIDKFVNTFDVVVLGDVIEHVADPESFLKEIYAVLRPGGFAIIKTPNLDCPEAKIFGPHYHSIKREHLVYFTNESLIAYATKTGFTHHKSISISHLLKGFVGEEITAKWAKDLNGSDLIVYFKKQ